MKKFLLAIAAATMMAGNVFADEATFTCKTDLGASTVAVTSWSPSDDFKFEFAANKGTAPSYNKAGDVRLYANNTATLTANNGITVQKVVFTISTQGKKRLCEVGADPGAIAAQAKGDATVTWTGSAATIVFTVDPNDGKAQYGSDGAEKAGQLDFDAVTITYTKPAGDKLNADMAFAETTVTASLGEDFTAPALTKATDGAITYTSSVETVATVTADGAVTLVGAGTTVIKASAAATDKYNAGSAEYTLVVIDPTIIYSNSCMSADCGFTAAAEAALNPWTIDSRYGLKATGYVSGANNARDGVMASPVLDLEGRKNITLGFETAVNQFKKDGANLSGDAMAEILDYVSVVVAEVTSDEMPAEWTKVGEVTLPASQSWSFIAQDPAIDLSAYAGKKVRVGFRYISTEACAGTWEVKNVVVKGEKDQTSTKLDADLAFSTDNATANLGEEFIAPALTKSTDAPIVYTSSDQNVATVDENGTVTLVAPGTTTITATAEANDKYYGGAAHYTLTVVDPTAIYSNSCMSADCGFTAWTVDGAANPWQIDSRYGLKATGYISGANNARDGVMASPVLDLEGRKNITLDFETAVNMFKKDGTNLAGDAMAEILDYVSVVVAEVTSDEMPAEWTKVGEVTLPTSQSWNFISQNPAIDLSAYAGKKVRVGFRYVSTEECAGTWEVKNVVVKGQKNDTAVTDVEADNTDAPAVYYNMQGVRVATPSAGLYIVVRGNKVTKQYIR